MDIATLGLRLDSGKLIEGSKRAKDSLKGVTQESEKTTKGLKSTTKAMIALASAFGLFKAAKLAKESVLLGARYETLGVVINVLGRNVGKTAKEMDDLQASLQRTGISMIKSREVMARMIGANIDLANATQLARLAQDAAVIGGINSSEAFARLISGISQGRTIILRTLGIFVDFNQALQDYAKANNTTVQALTEQQKVQIRANATMEAGTKIAGAYEAALGTAGKQLLSAQRYLEDTRVLVSKAFQPAFTELVFAYANALKFAGKHADQIAIAIKTAIIAVAALAAGLVWAAAAATAASIGGFAALAVALSPAVLPLAAVALGLTLIAEGLAMIRDRAIEAAREEELLNDAFVRGLAVQHQASLLKAGVDPEVARSRTRNAFYGTTRAAVVVPGGGGGGGGVGGGRPTFADQGVDAFKNLFDALGSFGRALTENAKRLHDEKNARWDAIVAQEELTRANETAAAERTRQDRERREQEEERERERQEREDDRKRAETAQAAAQAAAELANRIYAASNALVGFINVMRAGGNVGQKAGGILGIAGGILGGISSINPIAGAIVGGLGSVIGALSSGNDPVPTRIVDVSSRAAGQLAAANAGSDVVTLIIQDRWGNTVEEIDWLLRDRQRRDANPRLPGAAASSPDARPTHSGSSRTGQDQAERIQR